MQMANQPALVMQSRVMFRLKRIPSTYTRGDLPAMPGKMLIHRIVQHLADTMMQRALVGTTNVHSWLFADGLETLELGQFGSIIISRNHPGFILNRLSFLRHNNNQFCNNFGPIIGTEQITIKDKKTPLKSQCLSKEILVKNTISCGIFSLPAEPVVFPLKSPYSAFRGNSNWLFCRQSVFWPNVLDTYFFGTFRTVCRASYWPQ